MAYLPPNGGRMNVTIGSNTAGVSSLISSGTMTLAGGSNITLSQNGGNAITIHGGAGGAAGSNTFGMSNLGNTSGTSGVISGSALQYAFAGGNNVTLSQSINASSATITISAASQTVQTQNRFNATLSGNTAGVMAQVSSGTLTLAGGNNITLSQNGNAVSIIGGAGGGGGLTISNSETGYGTGSVHLAGDGQVTVYSAANQSFRISMPGTSSLSATGAFSISSNGATISMGVPAFSAGMSSSTYGGATGGTSGTASNQVVIAAGSNITLSQSTGAGGNTLAIHGPNALTSQSNQALSGSNGAFTFQTATFGSSNGMHFYTTNGSLVGSYTVPNVPSQTNQTIGFSAGVNTSLTSTGTFDARSMWLNGRGAASVGFSSSSMFVSAPQTSSISATGAVSVSLNGSTISIGAPAFSAGLSNIGNTTGTSGMQTNRVVLAGGSNITLSQSNDANGATVSIAGGGGGVALSGGGTSYSNGTVHLSAHGGGALTISGSTNSVLSLSVPAVSSLSATGAVSIVTNGSTISIGAPAPVTMNYFNPRDGYEQVTGAHGQGTLHMQPMQAPNVQFDRVAMPIYYSHATNSTASVTLSVWLGIYTRTASTLSLARSISLSSNWTGSGTANSTLFNGIRLLTIPFTSTLLEDQYYVGIISRSTTGGNNATISQLVASQQNSSFSGIFGAATNASIQYTRGLGYYSASTTAMPGSIPFTDIRGNSSMALRPPLFYFVNGTF